MKLAGDSLDKVRGRLQRLLRFLTELQQIRTPPPSQLDDYPWRLAAADLPTHQDLRHGSPEEDEFLLEVRRPKLTPCPPPPAAIAESLERGWDDSAKPVCWEQDEQGEAESRVAVSHGRLAQDWIEERSRWAEQDRIDQHVHRVFLRFYELFSRLQREGERFELLLADGVLRWQGPADIHHPLLLQRVELSFDPEIPSFQVRPTDQPVRLYSQILRRVGLDGSLLAECESWLGIQTGLELNLTDNLGRLLPLLRPLMLRLFPTDGETSAEVPSVRCPLPVLYPSSMLLLAPRNLGYATAVEAYAERLQELDDLPEAMVRLLAPEILSMLGPNPSSAFPEEEILLTKEANEAQRRIVRSLGRTGAVLVQGPPGTGKTHTIANVVGHLLAHGESVLVTAQTTKALKVLRDKVVEPLQPLCVSVLESDEEGRTQLESAIAGIVARSTETDPQQLKLEARRLAGTRRALLERLARAEDRLRGLLQAEHTPIGLAGESIAPAEAASWVRENADELSWVPGPLCQGSPLPLTEQELYELYASNSSIEAAEEVAVRSGLPDLDRAPAPDLVDTVLDQLGALEGLDTETGASWWSPAEQEPGPLRGLADRALRLADELAQLSEWQRQACISALQQGAEHQLWQEWTELLDAAANQLAGLRCIVVQRGPELPSAVPAAEAASWPGTCVEILEHLQHGGGLGGLKLLVNSRWKRLIATARVDGCPPASAEDFEALQALLRLGEETERFCRRWERQMVPWGAPASAELGVPIEQAFAHHARLLRSALAWPEAVCAPFTADLVEIGFDWPALWASIPLDVEDPARLRRLQVTLQDIVAPALEARANRLELEAVQAYWENLTVHLRESCHHRDGAGIGRDLIAALAAGDGEQYRTAWDRLAALTRLQTALQRRDGLLERLRIAAPAWAELVLARTPPHDAGTPPPCPRHAWRWRQLEEELQRRASEDVDSVQRHVTQLREQLRQVTTQFVDTRAWLHQLRNTDPVTHSALVGWADLIRRIGKGTGKRAPRLREEARQRLEQARGAVPVWIMPLARVFETCDFRKAQFDVVILDEASQCDVLGLLCLLLARRVIVVGDHEQVSPSAVGERQDQVQALIDHHLEGIPNNLLYDGKTSIYDLARQSFGGAIRLVEHFRCVPEIIQFSNQLCYGGEIKPLREASSILLRPHVVAHSVPWGRRDGKVNQGEARVVASLLLACLAQPEYRQSTFGVVSLLGEEQALAIDQLLRTYLQPEEYRTARLLCGTAAHFQGDERDVMFLSMVDSPAEGPLPMRADPGLRQRYNVAASRARDQLWVVHSLRPTLDLKADDLRLSLLRFAEEATGRKREVEEKSRRAESEFERLVLRNLIERGFRVVPQWSVGAYRIDMVVQGGQSRVAVECDGERYHGPDRLAQDLERQEILERLGWRFIRVRGSQFFRDPAKTTDWLVGRLDALGVEPMGGAAEATPEDGAGANLQQRVLQKADALRCEWGGESGAVVGSVAPATVAPAAALRGALPALRPQNSTSHATEGRRPEDGSAIAFPVRPTTASERRTRADTGGGYSPSVPSVPPREARTPAASSPAGGRADSNRPAVALQRTLPQEQPPPPVPASKAERRPTNGMTKPTVSYWQDDPVLTALLQMSPELAVATCPHCRGPIHYFVGRHGPFFTCEKRSCKKGTSVSKEQLDELALLMKPSCPSCSTIEQPASGPYGPYLRCPKCGGSESWKQLRQRLVGGNKDG